MMMNGKRKHNTDVSESIADLTNSEKGLTNLKRLKMNKHFVMEVKVDKNWLANSTSLHESLTLLSASKRMQSSSTDPQLSDLLNSQIDPEDLFMISEFTSQCTVMNHDIDSNNNVLKIYLEPRSDFNYTRIYSAPSNVEIRCETMFDQEMGESCFSLSNYIVGDIEDNDGI